MTREEVKAIPGIMRFLSSVLTPDGTVMFCLPVPGMQTAFTMTDDGCTIPACTSINELAEYSTAWAKYIRDLTGTDMTVTDWSDTSWVMPTDDELRTILGDEYVTKAEYDALPKKRNYRTKAMAGATVAIPDVIASPSVPQFSTAITVLDNKKTPHIVPIQQPPAVTAPRINTYAPSWYFQKKFNIDLAAFKAYASRTTGYANLDAEQYFYPGLYAIGAISSLGKTTFVHQLADQVASSGTPVLYFSLEQSAFELFTKSISRRINLHADSDPSYNRYTSLDIRRGIAGQREVIEQINAYISDVDGKLFVVECNFAATIEDIIRNVDDFINTYQMTPVGSFGSVCLR